MELSNKILALIRCGLITENEVKNKPISELSALVVRKTLQVAMAGREMQMAYRTAYQELCDRPYDRRNSVFINTTTLLSASRLALSSVCQDMRNPVAECI